MAGRIEDIDYGWLGMAKARTIPDHWTSDKLLRTEAKPAALGIAEHSLSEVRVFLHDR